jgi:hypothetical protein
MSESDDVAIPSKLQIVEAVDVADVRPWSGKHHNGEVEAGGGDSAAD